MYSLLPELWLDIADDLLTVCKLTMVSNILKDLLANKHEAMNNDPSDNDLRSIGLQRYYQYDMCINYTSQCKSKRPSGRWLIKDDNDYIVTSDKINQHRCYLYYFPHINILLCRYIVLLSPTSLSDNEIKNILLEPHMIPSSICSIIVNSIKNRYSLIDDRDGTHHVCMRYPSMRISNIHLIPCIQNLSNNVDILDIFKEEVSKRPYPS